MTAEVSQEISLEPAPVRPSRRGIRALAFVTATIVGTACSGGDEKGTSRSTINTRAPERSTETFDPPPVTAPETISTLPGVSDSVCRNNSPRVMLKRGDTILVDGRCYPQPSTDTGLYAKPVQPEDVDSPYDGQNGEGFPLVCEAAGEHIRNSQEAGNDNWYLVETPRGELYIPAIWTNFPNGDAPDC